MITQVVKLLVKQSSGEKYKRTWQGVSAKLESYIYKVHMVRATNNYACPYVHACNDLKLELRLQLRQRLEEE